jgi:uncharacterized membrane protein
MIDQSVIRAKRMSGWARFWAWLDTPAAAGWILLVILLIGAYLRLSHINWDMETHIHPDERFLTMVSDRLRLPASLGEYLDSTTSPLNPYNIRDGNGNMQFPLYVYGNLPLTIVRVAAEAANKFNLATHMWTPEGQDVPLDLTAYWGVHYVGRATSALFDLAGILVLYFIGRRLYGRRAGLLSAALLAFAPLPLQQSHFFTADTFATFFSLVTFYYCVRVAFGGKAELQDPPSADAEDGAAHWRPASAGGGWLSYLALGLSLGATIACRINLAPLAGIALLAIGMRAWREWSAGAARRRDGREDRAWVGFLLQATLFRTFLFGIAALLAFRVLMPYAFGGTSVLDFSFSDHWRDNMHEIQVLISGGADYPPGHQWTGRTPFVFPFVNMVVWGMGLPLGLAGWAGFLVAFWQIAASLVRPAYLFLARRHLLPVAWVGGMWVWQGLQFVQSMRYYLPLYPILCLFAAWLLWWLVEVANRRVAASRDRQGSSPARRSLVSASFLRPAAYVLLAGVTLGTILWGWGFLAIYRRPLTRITASRWMYDNIPAGAHIGNEHWDDQLPLAIDGRCAYKPCGPYEGLSSSSDGLMQMYGEDTPEKRELLYRWLDESDYIVLSSNRLWASIPRLPLRYPMTTLYYKLLFEGKLGFKQVAHFTSFPTIFGIQFDDTGAEEAFSVYDHPVVYIFQKTPDYSEARLREYFGSVDLENTIQMWPKQASQAPTALLMTALDTVRQQASGTWSALFNENSLINRLPVLFWLLLVELLGLVAFPILFVALRGLSDRGYAFAKTFGILTLAWLSWIGPSLKIVPFSRGYIAAVFLLLAIAGGVLAWRQRPALDRLWRERRSLLLTEEAIFLVLFGIFLLIRWGNPDLWHPARGGEKPMDFAYLNAVIRSTTFPPYDPWFAGGFINYYYFGFVMIGALVKLLGIVPAVAYNLAVPTLFALTGLGAFAVAYNLAEGDALSDSEQLRRAGEVAPVTSASPRFRPSALFAGFAGMIFVAMAGNLGEVKLLFDQWASHSPLQFQSTIPGLAGLVRTAAGAIAWLARLGPGRQALQVPNDWWFWNASRVIPDTINEFPFFTFTYADLHAHMIAFPLTLLALGAAVALVRFRPERPGRSSGTGSAMPNPWRITLAEVWPLLLLGFVLGALRATNTWDFPTYILVALSALVVLEFARRSGWRPGLAHAVVSPDNDPDRPDVQLESYRPGVPEENAMLASAQPLAATARPAEVFEPSYAAYGVSQPSAGASIEQVDPGEARSSQPTPAFGGSPAGPGDVEDGNSIEAEIAYRAQLAQAADQGPAPASTAPETAVIVEAEPTHGGTVVYPVAGIPAAAGPASLGRSKGAAVALPPQALSPWQETLVFLFQGAVSVIWRLLVVLVVATISFYPYTKWYATAYTGLQPWTEAKTKLSDYLVVWGFFLVLIVIYLISELVTQLRDDTVAGWVDEPLPFVVAALVLVVGVGWVLKAQIWLIAAPLLFLALLLALGKSIPPTRRLALLFIALGLAITMGVEVVRLQDDIGRMNTVFKFYLQAWILFGVATAYGTASWIERAATWTSGWRRLAQAVAVVLFIGAMLYPPLAARAKVDDRFSAEDQPRGLDGTAFMDQAQFFDQNQDLNLPADKAAIEWMLHNVQGSPVILEGNSPNYRWGSRFSIYTGLPTVFGWDWHERQQRSIVPGIVIDRRISHVRELYTNPDLARTEELLSLYKVKYVIVGALERAYYGAPAQAKFDTLAEQGKVRVVYDKDGVRIYEVAG